MKEGRVVFPVPCSFFNLCRDGLDQPARAIRLASFDCMSGIVTLLEMLPGSIDFF